jgi:IS605 OrfB family transposase
LNADTAHRISRRIVDFAQAAGASILVFEHLGNLRPERGKYSRRANAKRSYWLRGKMVAYAGYKAWNVGIVTCRVNPKDTSRRCARCGAEVARYKAGEVRDGMGTAQVPPWPGAQPVSRKPMPTTMPAA